MNFHRAWLLLPVLLGCDAQLAPGAVVGASRLKQQTLRAPGVPDLAFGSLDGELDEPCWLGTASDGERRCLPTYTLGFSGGFADAACTQALFFQTEPSCIARARRFGSRPLPGGCPARTEIHELEPTTAPRQVYLRGALLGADGEAACESASDENAAFFRQQAASGSVFRSKGVVEPERFVRVVGEERTRSTPVRELAVLEDGARLRQDMLDERGERCRLGVFQQGAYCLAEVGLATLGAYADGRCSALLYSGEMLDECGTERSVPRRIVERRQRCADELPSARLFTAVAQRDSYRTSRLGCVRESSEAELYTRGTELPFGTLAPLAQRREGSERLELLSVLDDRGEPLATVQYWDRALSMACFPARAHDGTMRCLPLALGSEVHADASCGGEARVQVGCVEGAPGQLISISGECGTRHVVRLGDAVVGSARLYTRSPSLVVGAGCRELVDAPMASEGTVFEIGDPLPPEAFVRFEEGTR